MRPEEPRARPFSVQSRKKGGGKRNNVASTCNKKSAMKDTFLAYVSDSVGERMILT